MSSCDDETTSANDIKTENNHIYFYADVDAKNALTLIEKLREIDTRLVSENIARWSKQKTPIWLHINSYGGVLIDGFAIADTISMIESPVFSVIEGMCASAATIISCACNMKYITLNSSVLIHQFSGWMYGTYEEMKDETARMEFSIKSMIEFYKKHTPMSKKEIKRMLKRNTWLNAPKAVKIGVCDKIITSKEIYG